MLANRRAIDTPIPLEVVVDLTSTGQQTETDLEEVINTLCEEESFLHRNGERIMISSGCYREVVRYVRDNCDPKTLRIVRRGRP